MSSGQALAQAKELFTQGNYQGVIQICQTLLQVDAKNPAVFLMMG